MELLRLTGEIVSIGDMPADEVPRLRAGVYVARTLLCESRVRA